MGLCDCKDSELLRGAADLESPYEGPMPFGLTRDLGIQQGLCRDTSRSLGFGDT